MMVIRSTAGHTGAPHHPISALAVHRYPALSTDVFRDFGYMIGYMTTKSGDLNDHRSA